MGDANDGGGCPVVGTHRRRGVRLSASQSAWGVLEVDRTQHL